MDAYFQTAISNALLVTAAAPVVWAISKLAGKPALTHALWLVVLIKLIVPPMWLIPFHLPQSRQLETERVPKAELPLAISPATDAEFALELTRVPDLHENFSAVRTSSTPQAAARPAASPFDIAHRWETALESLWIAGSLSCLAIAVIRMRRFERSLRHATLAPASVQLRIEHLAEHLGLSRAPSVLFIPGTLCPILWAVGRSARVLVPQALWERLDAPQRDAILIHELAHWRRRDHWVRWIELFVTSLYWWHPACWWACHELREAEEQCCDAWVLSTTGDFRHYANALLEAVEFVSSRVERPFNSTAVPALASGLGQFGRLKRRIIMLKNGNISRALSRYGIAATLGVASLLLPLSPVLAQEAPKPEAVTVPSNKANVVLDSSFESLNATLADKTSDEIQELRQARKQIAELSKKLDEAQARIKVLQQGEGTTSVRGNRISATGAASGYVIESDSPAPLRLKRVTVDATKPEPAGGSYARIVPDGNVNVTGTASVDRLTKIEAQLRSLLREVEAIRQRGDGAPATPENGTTTLQRK